MKNSRVTDINIDYPSPPSAGPPTKPPPDTDNFNWDEIYRPPSGENLAKQVAISRRRRFWFYLALVILLLGAGGGVSWLIWGQGASRFGEEAVQFNLSGPTELPSGQVAEYILSYSNKQGVGLKQIEINFRYPDGFTFMEASIQPDNKESTRFIIPAIGAEQSGVLVVRGQLIGELKDSKNLSVLIAYEPDNIKAQFTKTLTLTSQLVASVVNLELAGPDKIAVEQPTVLQVNYRNSSKAKLAGLRLRLNLPAGFELELPALPAAAGSNNIWQLPELEPQTEGKIELKGKFTASSQVGEQELTVAIGFSGSGPGVFAVQEEKVWRLALIGSQLKLNLFANDLVLKSQADLGQELKYELVLVNEGELPYSDFKIKVQLSPIYLDWSSLRDDFGGAVDSAAGTISWTADNLPLLKLLQPKSRATITWRLQTVSSLPSGAISPVSFSAQAVAEAKQLIDNKTLAVSVQANEVVTKFNSILSLAVEGRYYTDQLVKLGSGPLPPRVGQTTTYVIFWRLGNNLNDLENIEVTATLPLGVNWTGQTIVSAGQALGYNTNTREVRWLLNRLPAGAGITFTKPEGWFEVTVTPTESDADKILVLTKTTTATARDTVSGANLIATAKFITTELDDDLGAQGKGVVVR